MIDMQNFQADLVRKILQLESEKDLWLKKKVTLIELSKFSWNFFILELYISNSNLCFQPHWKYLNLQYALISCITI